MFRFFSLGILIMLVTGQVNAQPRTQVTQSACLSFYGKDEKALKQELLATAKRSAIEELFGARITSLSRLDNFALTRDQIETYSVGLVRVEGDPEYYASGFGQGCVRINAYATAEDFARLEPKEISKKSCESGADSNTTKQGAESRAKLEALLDYDARLRGRPSERLHRLLRQVKYDDRGFISGTSFYCVRATGVIYPLEVEALVRDSGPPAVPVPLQQAIGFYTGRGGNPVDYAKARRLFRQAAETGSPLAKMWLGRLYYRGRAGFQQDEARGESLAREVIQDIRNFAKAGDTQAMFLLGSAYDEGLATEPDEAQAVTWYRKAAEQGHAIAQFILGVMYEYGRGVQQSDTEAVTWYRKAAEQRDAGAQNNLGRMYAGGRGVQQSDTEAVTWYRKAAEQGDASAQFILGFMYEYGRGVWHSYTKAVTWYRKAAEQGDASAQNNLGGMYEYGLGVQQSDTKAAMWYRKAAEQRDADAQRKLQRLEGNW